MRKQPDASIFYSLAVLNNSREKAAKEADWGMFITPITENRETSHSSEPALNAVDFSPFLQVNPIFDAIIQKINSDVASKKIYRCSAKYYVDCYNVIMEYANTVQRIVEVGPQFGDLSSLFAGTLSSLNATLDLVDIDKTNLFYTYEKISRIFPEAINKVRLFFGDLPAYIQNVALPSPQMTLLHYHGSSNFNDTVRDLGATFYARQSIIGTMIHNTHLRTTNMNHYAFADVALYALFGVGLNFAKLGYEAKDETPVDYTQNPPTYLAPYRVDGMFIPYAQNHFRYPHVDTKLDTFLYQPQELHASI